MSKLHKDIQIHMHMSEYVMFFGQKHHIFLKGDITDFCCEQR